MGSVFRDLSFKEGPGRFWVDFGMTLGSLWDDFGVILGSLWDDFGDILESLWGHFGITLGQVWELPFLYCSEFIFKLPYLFL